MKKFLLILFSVLFFVSGQSRANNIAGAYLNYDYISGNQYLVNLIIFRDCAGISAPPTIEVCYHSDSCNFNSIITLSVSPNITNVPQCPYLPVVVSTCNGGTGFGLEMYTYTGVLILPFVCTDWELSYSAPQTGGPFGPAQPNFNVTTKIDNLNYPNNNSPDFTTIPIFEYCIAQLGYDDLSATDSDGDSLCFELIQTVTDSFICPPQQAPPSQGYFLFLPLSSTPYYIDSTAGWLNFTPSMIQIGHITVRVSEFRLGQLINETLISHMTGTVGGCIATNLETPLESNMSIYPNPVNDQLNIHIPENGLLQIISATGQKVYSESKNVSASEDFQLNVSHLSPGVYYLLLNDKNVFNGKMFVKN